MSEVKDLTILLNCSLTLLQLGVEEISSHKFLPLMYQLAARMSHDSKLGDESYNFQRTLIGVGFLSNFSFTNYYF